MVREGEKENREPTSSRSNSTNQLRNNYQHPPHIRQRSNKAKRKRNSRIEQTSRDAEEHPRVHREREAKRQRYIQQPWWSLWKVGVR